MRLALDVVSAPSGESILSGIRAGLCHDTYSAHEGVEHDDINVLVLGRGWSPPKWRGELVRSSLSAKFTGEERHVRQLEKIRKLESSFQELFG